MQKRSFFFCSVVNAVISVKNLFLAPLRSYASPSESVSRSLTTLGVALDCEYTIERSGECFMDTPSGLEQTLNEEKELKPYIKSNPTGFLDQHFLISNTALRSFSALNRLCSSNAPYVNLHSGTGLCLSRRCAHTVSNSNATSSGNSTSSKSRRKKLKRSKRASIVTSLPVPASFNAASSKSLREKSTLSSSSIANAPISNSTSGTNSAAQKFNISKGLASSHGIPPSTSSTSISTPLSVDAAATGGSSSISKKSKGKQSKKRQAIIPQDDVIRSGANIVSPSLGGKGSPVASNTASLKDETTAQLFPSSNPPGNNALVEKKKKKMKIKMVKRNGKMVRVAVPLSSSSPTVTGTARVPAALPSPPSLRVSDTSSSLPRTASPTGVTPSAKTRSSSNASSSSTSKALQNPILFPDHREQILRIFQQLGEVNNALGEVYKSKSYTFALQELRRGDYIFRVLPPNLSPLRPDQVTKLLADPDQQSHLSDMTTNLERRQRLLDPHFVLHGVGDKLRKKIVEILETGDLQELHAVNKRPEVSAMRELCEVHGFGPRTALSLYRSHKIKTVAELKKMAASPDCPVSLNDGQRLGLKYFDDIQKRIPHEEGKLHEAYLKARLKKHFGSAFLLTVCGSFRRRTDFSGDIDVLLTPNPEYLSTAGAGSKKASGKKGSENNALVSLPVPPQDAVRAFVDALREDGYIEATFAQGSTKFMGMSRLKGSPSSTGVAPVAKGKKNKKGAGKKVDSSSYLARRIDVRYVDAPSFPAALLYFTGSKNFNVVMRARAVKLHLVLNEYGLFQQNFEAAAHGSNHRPLSSINELITRLTKYQFWSRGENALSDPAIKDHASKQKELDWLVKQLNFLRVKTTSEQDIFDVLGMSYVEPWERCM